MKKMQKPYKDIDFPPLSEEQIEMLKKLDDLPNDEIDTSEIPEATGNGGFYYIQS